MEKGDFIKIEYEGRLVTTGNVFDTTSEALAKSENIHEEHRKYGPMLVVVGEGMVLPGVEKRLLEMKLNEEKEFNLKPEEAFGRRNPMLIQIVSMATFLKEKINPVPGLYVTINNRRARIQSVSGGRVRVDFNHPLAGKELNYKVKIVKTITVLKEKIDAVFEYFGIKGETQISEGILSLKSEKPITEPAQKLVTETIKRWIPEVKEIKFSSRGEKKEEKTEKETRKKEETKS